ncbi:unnamed protein product [Brachionus calyciflorus]|uniref:Fungal lipase-type domain-containing protein n=1 Tax=Brachionus calyciflorus TaxID=104777 RepID=A0A813WVA4_9BILA|nr:unnamed protein product [Brachionus calyciflorus]
MTNIPKEIEQNYPNYAEILLNSAIASRIVYEDDPISLLKTNPYCNLSHSLNKLCISQSYKSNYLKYVNPLNDIKYLIADLGLQRLLVAFRGSQSKDDFLTDAQIHSASSVYTGQIHSGFYDRAERVPINFYIQKLSQGYQLIFTGHSLGAAISCLIAIKLILNTRIGRENPNKILFIGYGCPLIADKDFKNHIELKHKLNFHFIQNEDDVVVKALNFLSNKIHADNNVKQEITPSTNNNSLFSKIQKGWEMARPILKGFIPHYEQFGILLKLDKSGLKIVDHLDQSESNIKEFNNLNSLVSQARNHFMNNYFDNLKLNHFKDLVIGKRDSIQRHFDYIKDLHLSENSKYFVRVIRKLDGKCDISINIDIIENKENILFGKLILNEAESYNSNDHLKENLIFKFDFEWGDVFKNGKMVNEGDFFLIGHFNSICIRIKFDESKVEEDLVLKTKTVNEKRLETAAKAFSIGLKFLSKK